MNTLAGLMDRCATPMGSRMLEILAQSAAARPACARPASGQAVATLHVRASTISMRERHEIGDLERILTRIALRSARPRDLARIAARTDNAARRFAQPSRHSSRHIWPRLGSAAGATRHNGNCSEAAVVETPPILVREGGVIATGFDADLDELRTISADANRFLDDLETNERERTGLSNLKVGYNRVHGYYIEISKVQAQSHRRTTSAVKHSRAPSVSSRPS